MVHIRAQTMAPTPAPECSSPKTRDDLADAISSALESTGSLVLCDRTKVKFSPSDDHIKVGKLNGGSEALSLSVSCEDGGSCVVNGDKDRTWRGMGGYMRVSGGGGCELHGHQVHGLLCCPVQEERPPVSRRREVRELDAREAHTRPPPTPS